MYELCIPVNSKHMFICRNSLLLTRNLDCYLMFLSHGMSARIQDWHWDIITPVSQCGLVYLIGTSVEFPWIFRGIEFIIYDNGFSHVTLLSGNLTDGGTQDTPHIPHTNSELMPTFIGLSPLVATTSTGLSGNSRENRHFFALYSGGSPVQL